MSNDQLDVGYHFACPIYTIDKPEFLEQINDVSEESLKRIRDTKEQGLNEIYPVLMSENYYNDPRVQNFAEYIGQTVWNILQSQGYDMHDKGLAFTEMWTQEHHKHSGMEQHIHGYGAQIVGFYFLEAPEGSSRVVFHDPRASKLPIDLPETDVSIATVASKMINYEPKPGRFIFVNAWLAHAFTRHAADSPIKFVHFNLTVMQGNTNTCPSPSQAEVI